MKSYRFFLACVFCFLSTGLTGAAISVDTRIGGNDKLSEMHFELGAFGTDSPTEVRRIIRKTKRGMRKSRRSKIINQPAVLFGLLSLGSCFLGG